MRYSIGYAVIRNDMGDPGHFPDVGTVAPTEIGAKVNGLVTLFKIPIYNTHTAAEINLLFEQHRGDYYVSRVYVSTLGFMHQTEIG